MFLTGVTILLLRLLLAYTDWPLFVQGRLFIFGENPQASLPSSIMEVNLQTKEAIAITGHSDFYIRNPATGLFEVMVKCI